jgi:hypothetical protein
VLQEMGQALDDSRPEVRMVLGRFLRMAHSARVDVVPWARPSVRIAAVVCGCAMSCFGRVPKVLQKWWMCWRSWLTCYNYSTLQG